MGTETMAAGRHAAPAGLLILPAIAIVLFILASCALVRPVATVIQRPSGLSGLPGDRPWLYALYRPLRNEEYMVELDTPEGAAYLIVGPALKASYDKALGAFFSLNRVNARGAGQIAVIDLDRMEFSSRAESLGPGRARLVLRLRQPMRIDFPEGGTIDEMTMDVSVEGTIDYSGRREFIEKAGDLAAGLFNRLEYSLLDYLLRNDRPDKYIPRGASRPASAPRQSP